MVLDEGLARPILLGRPEVVAAYPVAKTLSSIPVRVAGPLWVVLRTRLLKALLADDHRRYCPVVSKAAALFAVGSVATALLALAIYPYISIYYKILLILFTTLLGIAASAAYTRRQAVEDPQDVVIDEVAGQFLALACAPPHWAWYLAGFALFRLFDITKPFPANWCDRNLKGGTGVMADDLVAGLYAIIFIALGEYLVRSI